MRDPAIRACFFIAGGGHLGVRKSECRFAKERSYEQNALRA